MYNVEDTVSLVCPNCKNDEGLIYKSIPRQDITNIEISKRLDKFELTEFVYLACQECGLDSINDIEANYGKVK